MNTHCASKVLLVDDDPHLLRLLSIRLQAAGHEVTPAHDGLSTLR